MNQPVRKYPRFAVAFAVELIVGHDRVVGQTHDVSRGGLCLQLGSPIDRGTECTLKLALVFTENSFSEQLTLQGTVVWCSTKRGQFQIGVKFNDMDGRTLGYLDTCLHYLEMGALEEDDSSEP
jgi:hypothetical protein